MRRVITVLIAGLIAAATACPAFAWEFEMKGEFESRFRYYGSMGNNDLFGVRGLQDVNAVGRLQGFAGPNIYGIGGGAGIFASQPKPSSNLLFNVPFPATQMAVVRGGFSESGSDAFYLGTRLTFYPAFRVNSAIRVFGVYNVGGYRNKYFQNASAFGGAAFGPGIPPFERYYSSQSSSNANDTAAIGSWEQFRAVIQIPWGVISVGVKDFPLGTGATFAHNTRAEEFLFVAPYGPMRLMTGIWLARARGAELWTSIPDGTEKNSFFGGFLFTYDNANLSIGGGTLYRFYHGNKTARGTDTRDDSTILYAAFVKYNNGRFFANAEYAIVNVDRYRTDNVPFTPLPLAQTFFMESYHSFAEVGTIIGPAKLSLMWAQASGFVLNNRNRLTFTSPTGPHGFFPAGAVASRNPKVYAPFAINYQATEPYEWLMFNTYAGGNNGGWNAVDITFTADDHGMMTDAYAFAARMDYAIASNLNMWASYIWAHRLERAGVFFGQYDSNGNMSPNNAAFYANAGRAQGVGADYVSNGFLGWEANIGVDWKLLEGLTVNFRYAYWQPGDYFKEAYQAFTVNAGAVTANGVLESRDAINAFQGSLLIQF